MQVMMLDQQFIETRIFLGRDEADDQMLQNILSSLKSLILQNQNNRYIRLRLIQNNHLYR